MLNRSERREQRVRRLPAHVMIRYVIAMGCSPGRACPWPGRARRASGWPGGWPGAG
ncbi:transposase domain-containing protein [Dactylosporangium fulvum]|uniref:Transposase domain-containing protein n=1 Tax=Dactylosporangium fulvum TaxID=53359 RepID=A0ABY5VUQ8_9ACTN|nr:transposase domain-containing protein [Dactylosporangium fulvum]UWP80549.1 transposase domain-containing protein [Dactylosporangium fulvum]